MKYYNSALPSIDMTLTNTQILEAEYSAKEVLDGFYKGKEISLPIPIEEIAKHLGLTVQVVNFTEANVSGVYQRDSKSIYVSDKDSEERRVFTIAHELGHAIMHKDYPGEVFYRNDTVPTNGSGLPDPKEQEANWFAASILMPREIVEKYWKFAKDEREMADLFGVSYPAIHYRLKNLFLC